MILGHPHLDKLAAEINARWSEPKRDGFELRFLLRRAREWCEKERIGWTAWCNTALKISRTRIYQLTQEDDEAVQAAAAQKVYKERPPGLGSPRKRAQIRPGTLKGRVLELFGDGQWHDFDAMLAELGVAPEKLAICLRNIEPTARLERWPGSKRRYRFFPYLRAVGAIELAAKLGPLVDALIIEGKKSSVRMSPTAVLSYAVQIQKLLATWTSSGDDRRARSSRSQSAQEEHQQCSS